MHLCVEFVCWVCVEGVSVGCVLEGEGLRSPVQNYPSLEKLRRGEQKKAVCSINRVILGLTINMADQALGQFSPVWALTGCPLLLTGASSPPPHLPQWALIFPRLCTYIYINLVLINLPLLMCRTLWLSCRGRMDIYEW